MTLPVTVILLPQANTGTTFAKLALSCQAINRGIDCLVKNGTGSAEAEDSSNLAYQLSWCEGMTL